MPRQPRLRAAPTELRSGEEQAGRLPVPVIAHGTLLTPAGPPATPPGCMSGLFAERKVNSFS